MFTWAAISTAFKTNPVVRWAAAAGAVIIATLTWLALHDRKIRELERLKTDNAARKESAKVITKARETANERVESAEEARNSVPDGVTSDSMSDDAYEYLFGRKRNDRPD